MAFSKTEFPVSKSNNTIMLYCNISYLSNSLTSLIRESLQSRERYLNMCCNCKKQINMVTFS